MSRSKAEEADCMALNEWALRQSVTIPQLRLLFHIPNGGLRPFKVDDKGRRYSNEAMKLQRMGVRKGVWDYLLPVARKYHGAVRHGLFIEMKDKDGALSAEQKWWQSVMLEENYAMAVCRTWLHARDIIIDYLDVLHYVPALAKQ